MKIDDLTFTVKYWDFNKKKFVNADLLASDRTKSFVAMYIKDKKTHKYDIKDPLLFIFGDFWSRREWEFMAGDLDAPETLKKFDVYEFFVKPNEFLLMGMINDISYNEAESWLREYNKTIKFGKGLTKKKK